MREQIDRFLGSIADGVGRAVTDIRSKLIDEGFWGRHVPELSARDGLQALWGKDAPAAQEPGFLDRLYQKNPDASLGTREQIPARDLDYLFAAYPKHFAPTQEISTRDEDRGLDLDR